MSENKVIIPTIGRRVWFWPAGLRRTEVVCNNPSVPMDAGIVYVWGDRMVNLDVTDHAGNHHAFTSVDLWQGDGDRPNGAYCEWMPYQKGQASKPDDIKALVAAAVDELFKPGTIRLVPKGRAEWAAHMESLDGATDRSDLTFGRAIALLKAGKRVARQGWNGKGMWLELQVPDQHSKMTLPYLYLNYPVGSPPYPEGARVPWLASQTDVLAEDWAVVL